MTASYQAKDELLSALKWQLEMGIDCALGDTAEGLYAHSVQPVRPVPPSTQGAQNLATAQERPAGVLGESAAPPSQFAASKNAGISIAAFAGDLTSIQTLDELKAALQAFEGVH